jgi:hypothetical protein
VQRSSLRDDTFAVIEFAIVPILGPIQLRIQRIPRFISFSVELPDRDADQLLPFKFEAKNVWIFSSVLLHAPWYGAWEQNQIFTFQGKLNENA